MFTGRISVWRYVGSILVLILCALVASLVLMGLYYFVLMPLIIPHIGLNLGLLFAITFGGMFLAFLPFLLVLPYMIGLQVRRFHDINLTGWTVLVLIAINWAASFFFPAMTGVPPMQTIEPAGMAIAVVLAVVGLCFTFWPGTKGPNKFGEKVKYTSVWSAIRGKKPVV